jgi:hypothetical protein
MPDALRLDAGAGVDRLISQFSQFSHHFAVFVVASTALTISSMPTVIAVRGPTDSKSSVREGREQHRERGNGRTRCMFARRSPVWAEGRVSVLQLVSRVTCRIVGHDWIPRQFHDEFSHDFWVCLWCGLVTSQPPERSHDNER